METDWSVLRKVGYLSLLLSDGAEERIEIMDAGMRGIISATDMVTPLCMGPIIPVITGTAVK